jgi:hypothetical protein
MVSVLWCGSCTFEYYADGAAAICPWVHDITFCDILINFVAGSIIPRLKCAVVKAKVVGR